MKTIGIHHVSIGCSDLDAAIEFYGWFGLTIDPTRPNFDVGGAWLQAGKQQVHLISTDITPPGIENHYAFIVDDLDATVAMLEGHGVKVARAPHFQGAGFQAFLNDPSGNVVELNQPDAETTVAAI